MLLNDLSARDYQFKTPQWMPGKTFDGAAPCGPALVTPDEAGPHDAIEIELTLNGEVMQKGSTADLVHSVPALVAYLSKLMTLEPGDVVSTGTPGGRRQPARPEGVAEAGRRGRDQLAAAGRARDARLAARPDRHVAADCLGEQSALRLAAQTGTLGSPPDRCRTSSSTVPLLVATATSRSSGRGCARTARPAGSPRTAGAAARVALLGQVAQLGGVGLAFAVVARDQADQHELARAEPG